MQNIDIMELEENFESRLREIMQRPVNPPSSESVEHLRDAWMRRSNEYEEVIDILKKSRGRGLGAEYHWTEEYLEIAGNTTTDLAWLLVDEKYDSPWIFRPAYNELFSTEPMLPFSASQTFFYPHHSPGCGHRVDASSQKLVSVEEHGLDQDHLTQFSFRISARKSEETTPRGHARTDLLLGIAGYVPHWQSPPGLALWDRGHIHEACRYWGRNPFLF